MFNQTNWKKPPFDINNLHGQAQSVIHFMPPVMAQKIRKTIAKNGGTMKGGIVRILGRYI